MGKNRNEMKQKKSQQPSVANDQIGENASGYDKQNEKYKNNNKSK